MPRPCHPYYSRLDSSRAATNRKCQAFRTHSAGFPPCPPVFPVVLLAFTQQNHGEHGEEEVLADQGSHSSLSRVWVAAEQSEAALGEFELFKTKPLARMARPGHG